MNTKREIEDFVGQKTLAVAGLSRDEKAFGSMVRKELEGRGYRILAVNPNATEIGGRPCYPDLSSLPEKVDGVLVATSPVHSEAVVRQAAAQGIRRVWLQQGAQSEGALSACRELGLVGASGKCILMFAEPVGSVHAVHRWFAKVFGTLPR